MIYEVGGLGNVKKDGEEEDSPWISIAHRHHPEAGHGEQVGLMTNRAEHPLAYHDHLEGSPAYASILVPG